MKEYESLTYEELSQILVEEIAEKYGLEYGVDIVNVTKPLETGTRTYSFKIIEPSEIEHRKFLKQQALLEGE